MAFRRLGVAASIVIALSACSSSEPSSPPPPDAGAGCADAGELTIEGSCETAGVPSNGCGEGFESDGRGSCTAILPADDCPAGSIAVPGDSVCRDVAPCAQGRWGAIPIDGSTQFVDGSFIGDPSDGSADRPWTSIQTAVDAAAPGALVAIAAGSYLGPIYIDHPVRLWGVCPKLVEVRGSPLNAGPAIGILAGAGPVEIHSLAVGASWLGVGIIDTEAELDEVWIHDCTAAGVQAEASGSDAQLSFRRSLVEGATQVGVLGTGAHMTIEESVVRDTRLDASVGFGRGIGAIRSEDGKRPSVLTVRRSLVERSFEAGIFVSGSTADVDATLVRQTDSTGTDIQVGPGILVVTHPGITPVAQATVQRSVFETNTGIGVVVESASLTMDACVVRDTIPDPGVGKRGRGVMSENGGADGSPSELIARQSMFERNHEVEVLVTTGAATLERCVFRDTLPQASDGAFGDGIAIQPDEVLGTQSTAIVRDSVLLRNREAGLFVAGSAVTVDHSRIVETAARVDGTYGDGIVVVPYITAASVALNSADIARNTRAGIANFSADATVGASTIACNAVDLDGEAVPYPFAYVDQGGNHCGCPAGATACTILTSTLTAPGALPR